MQTERRSEVGYGEKPVWSDGLTDAEKEQLEKQDKRKKEQGYEK